MFYNTVSVCSMYAHTRAHTRLCPKIRVSSANMSSGAQITEYACFRFRPNDERDNPASPFEVYIPISYIDPFDQTPYNELSDLQKNCHSVHRLRSCILTGRKAGFAALTDIIGLNRRTYVGYFDVENGDIRRSRISKQHAVLKQPFKFDFPTLSITDAQPTEEDVIEVQRDRLICAALMFRPHGAGRDRYLYDAPSRDAPYDAANYTDMFRAKMERVSLSFNAPLEEEYETARKWVAENWDDLYSKLA